MRLAAGASDAQAKAEKPNSQADRPRRLCLSLIRDGPIGPPPVPKPDPRRADGRTAVAEADSRRADRPTTDRVPEGRRAGVAAATRVVRVDCTFARRDLTPRAVR